MTSLVLATRPTAAANCVLFARAETGIAFQGAAGGWWDEAAGRYARGHLPVPGAIVVFRRTGRMRSGHVAVVSKIVSASEILIDHANWPHGTISRGISVIDTSTDHDWTQVAVIDQRSAKYGRDNPVSGFIYSRSRPHEIVENGNGRWLDSYGANNGVLSGLLLYPDLIHLVAATEYLAGASRRWHPAIERIGTILTGGDSP